MSQEENKNKKLLTGLLILEIAVVALYLALVLISCFALEKGALLNTIIIIATIVFIGACAVMVNIEVGIGYHECENCHHKFVPTRSEAIMAIHAGTTRYLKCPKCGKRSWAKKVLSK